MHKHIFWSGLALSFLLAWASVSFAAKIPDCLDGGQLLPIDNEEVIYWKTSTPNQFVARAHVSGNITQLFKTKNGHAHFEIALGKDKADTLEVIYNLSFGKLPALKKGAFVEACGDYITSTAPAGGYVASPSGALIHWVHKNPKGKGHDSGYVVLDGKLFGYGTSAVIQSRQTRPSVQTGFMPESMREAAN